MMTHQNANKVMSPAPEARPTVPVIFDSEPHCRRYLAAIHREQGTRCPACNSDKLWWNARSDMGRCAGCGTEINIRFATPMASSKQTLRDWFAAAWLLAGSSSRVSPGQLMKLLGLGRYEQAFQLLRELHDSSPPHAGGQESKAASGLYQGRSSSTAMVPPFPAGRLRGTVEVAEMVLASGRVKLGGLPQGPGEVLVLGAVEVRGSGSGRLRLATVGDLSASTLSDFVCTHVEPSRSTVLTGGLVGYHRLSSHGYGHLRVGRPGQLNRVRQLPRIHRAFEDLNQWLISQSYWAPGKDLEALFLDYQSDPGGGTRARHGVRRGRLDS
ncbi:MAG: hypothetical protein CMP23_17535 [Rickettsiales bacterium]|nr:hypothetical protein [Rickettsiales bacterium]